MPTDNVTLPGVGEIVATDEISSVQYQYVKLADGTLGGTGKVAADATNGLDVDVTRLPLQSSTSAAISASGASGGGYNQANGLGFILNGEANVTFQLTGSWVGIVTFEASNDNANWASIWGYHAGSSAIHKTATANGIYRCTTSGFGYVRARMSTWTSGTSCTIYGRTSQIASGTFQNFPAVLPHSNLMGEGDYTQVSKNVEYTTAQTGAAVWTPTSGKKIVITSWGISAYGSTDGHVTLWWSTSATNDTTFSHGTDYAIFDGTMKPATSTALYWNQSGTWIGPLTSGPLNFTSDANISVSVVVWGYEV